MSSRGIGIVTHQFILIILHHVCLWSHGECWSTGKNNRSVLRQGGGVTWGVRRHPVDLGINEREMKSIDCLDHRGVSLLWQRWHHHCVTPKL